HAMLACHYLTSGNSGSELYPTPYALAERVLSVGGDQTIIDECKRLYAAYFNQYGNVADEGVKPLGVELPCGIEGIHTSRLDLLANIGDSTWIVEHKTASRESRDVIEGWWLDGEIIGEVYAYKLSKLEQLYGPLAGVIVNITIKTQVPKFRRVEVVV